MTKKVKITFFLITVLAFFLRFYELGFVPASPDWDEAALGYNAYSIIKTGKDEYGQFLPLTFRSFDDYKPPLYVYLTIPPVALFGLNEFSVRLPSATVGLLTVIATYFLIQELFGKKSLSLLSMFFMAISPWSLQFSRVAFETNIALGIIVIGAAFFLIGVKRKPNFIIFSALLFALSLYSYHSARVFGPLLLFGLAAIFRKELFAFKKYVFIAVIVGIVLSLPLVGILTSKEGQLRLKGVSVFADQTNLLRRNIVKIEEDQRTNFSAAKLLHNRRITYVLTLFQNYISHFKLNWLFITGDIKRHHVPDMGTLYPIELPFILAGIYFLISDIKIDPKGKKAIFWWFLVAPIAAVPTTQLPHSVRTLSFLPTWHFFTALGIIKLYEAIKNNGSYKKLYAPIILSLLIINILYYLHQYYVHMPYEYAYDWQYGYRELVSNVKTMGLKYEKIIVSPKLDQPYMFFLFYLKYDPVEYLKGGGTRASGFKDIEHKFGKYEFRLFDFGKEYVNSKYLFVGTPEEIRMEEKVIKTIYYPNGEIFANIAAG